MSRSPGARHRAELPRSRGPKTARSSAGGSVDPGPRTAAATAPGWHRRMPADHWSSSSRLRATGTPVAGDDSVPRTLVNAGWLSVDDVGGPYQACLLIRCRPLWADGYPGGVGVLVAQTVSGDSAEVLTPQRCRARRRPGLTDAAAVADEPAGRVTTAVTRRPSPVRVARRQPHNLPIGLLAIHRRPPSLAVHRGARHRSPGSGARSSSLGRAAPGAVHPGEWFPARRPARTVAT